MTAQVHPAKVPAPLPISPKARKEISFVLQLAKWTRIIPWRWDKYSGTINLVQPAKFLHRWRTLAYFHIACRLFIPLYVLGSLLFRNVPPYEIFLITWNIGIQMMTTVALIHLVKPSMESEFRGIVNGVYSFNKFLLNSEDFTRKTILSHETENLLSLFITTAGILATIIGPAVGLLLSSGTLELAWIFKYFEFPSYYFFVSLFVAYFYAMDITVVLWLGFCCILYTDIMSNWLGELKWKASYENEAEENRNRRLQIIFRAHQVLHRHVEEYIFNLVPILVGLILIICVTVLYSLFGLYQVLNYFVLIICTLIAVVCIVMLKFVCNVCGKFTINSLAYRESFRRIEVVNKSEADICFFESLQPIIFHIGPYKEINNSIFQPIVTNVVTNWVITLLLSLERPFPRSTAPVQYNEF